jgi:rod shape-determining protein MreD
MFQKTITLLIIFLAAILQISVFPNLFPSSMAPEIVLIIVIFWAVQEGFEKTWPKVVAAGFVLDLFYFLPIGFSIIALSFVAYGTGFVAKRFLVSQKNLGFLMALLLVMGGTFMNDLILFALVKILNSLGTQKISSLATNIWEGKIFLRIAINLAVFIIIYWPLAKLEKFLSFYGEKSMQGRFFR